MIRPWRLACARTGAVKKTRATVDCCSCAHALDDDSCGGPRGYSNRRDARTVRSAENEEVVDKNSVLLRFTVTHSYSYYNMKYTG